jgi:hypothetical protein
VTAADELINNPGRDADDIMNKMVLATSSTVIEEEEDIGSDTNLQKYF